MSGSNWFFFIQCSTALKSLYRFYFFYSVPLVVIEPLQMNMLVRHPIKLRNDGAFLKMMAQKVMKTVFLLQLLIF